MQALMIAALLVVTAPILANHTLINPIPNTLDTASVGNQNSDVIELPVELNTKTQFNEEEERISEEIPFNTTFEEDPEEELGYQETIQEGVNGTKTFVYKITYWEGEEVSRELVETIVDEPVDEIVVKGTKVILRNLDTDDLGSVEYNEQRTVWATSYDGNCVGCIGTTFTGKKVTHGICAVDPTVIPLGTAFYVPGYGMCSAQDIGGGVKGNHIDLGFEDIAEGWWSARFVDIYILP